MPFRNTPEQYGAVTKSFHWLMAVMVLTMLAVGLYMTGAPLAQKFTLYNLHKSTGICVLALVLLRILWHIFTGRPKLVKSLKPVEKAAAHVAHVLLYYFMFAMPMSGWAMSSAYGRSVEVFGLFTLPDFTAPDPETAKGLAQIHGTLAWCLIATIVLHVCGALKHHLIDKDTTLRRMLPVLLLCLFLPSAAGANDQPPPGCKHPWGVAKNESEIMFSGRQMGADFSGRVTRYEISLCFDPKNPETGYATVLLDATSLTTGNADRDTAAATPEWFDVKAFPLLRYVADSFSRGEGENAYVAHGTLTIKDHAVPVDLPFTLTLTKTDSGKDKAKAEGKVTLNRSIFSLGTGDWADPSVIANEVGVHVKLVAEVQPPAP